MITSPLILYERRLETDIGSVILLTDANDVVRVLDFADYSHRMTTLLDNHYGRHGWIIERPCGSNPAFERVTEYFKGDIDAIDDIATLTSGTDFQKRVWSALRTVRSGSVETYGALACRIGQPNASRAVGLANGANPIAIIIPCHRIIGSNGKLTGYGGGLDRKRWLIDHELRFSSRDNLAHLIGLAL